MPRRCALGCPPSGTRMHCFPDPEKYPDKFLTWANLAGVKLPYFRICQIHGENLKKYFVSTAINILLHSWCRSINRILSGKIVYHGDDFTKNAAQRYYNKHRHYRNKK
ncbi:hypothetical protein ABMA27_012457 [Loxostege sticticalis]|uniref:Uncharacterized protein n=1 Tax=Loxostege sticticalis TaxID=481309 RepID=A0ABR3H1D8_LOXSC